MRASAHVRRRSRIAADGNVIAGNTNEVLHRELHIARQHRHLRTSCRTTCSASLPTRARPWRRVRRRRCSDECRLEHDRRQRHRRRELRDPTSAAHLENTVVRNLIGSNTADPRGPDLRRRQRRDLDGRRAVSVHRRCDGERHRRRVRATATPFSTRGGQHRGRLGLEPGLVQHGHEARSTPASASAAARTRSARPTSSPTTAPRSTGVAVISGNGNRITQNSIDGNLGLGIDLNDDGVDTERSRRQRRAWTATRARTDLQNYPAHECDPERHLDDGGVRPSVVAPGHPTRSSSSRAPPATRAATARARRISAPDTVASGSGGLPTSFTSTIHDTRPRPS